MKLESITIGEYCQLDEDEREVYDFAVKYSVQSEPRDVLSFGDITKKTFGEVKDWQQRFSSQDAFVKFLTHFEEKCLSLDVFSFFAFYRYVQSEVERVSLIESQLLAHEPTAEEQAAGLERFAKLGVGIQIDNLAKGKVWMYETIRALPYEECLFKLVLDKTNNDFQIDYQKVLNNKYSH